MNKLYSLDHLINSIEALKMIKQPILMKNLKSIQKKDASKYFIVRCDVERTLEHTLMFAKRMSSIKIPCTFYFHTRTDCYDPKILNEIRKLGHEIGYHHECLDRKRGDYLQAIELLEEEIKKFAKDSFILETICAHGEPGLKKNGYKYNYDLIKKYPDILKKYNLEEVYINIKENWSPYYVSDVFSSYKYFWRKLEAIKDQNENVSQILLHPHRWHNNIIMMTAEILKDVYQYVLNRILGKRKYNAISIK